MLAVLTLSDGEMLEDVTDGTWSGSEFLVDHILQTSCVPEKESLHSC